MRVHRLTLTNYRGIAHREIEFADTGVTVVSGANEIGKSSMIEALDLLLEAKDRSSRKEVKQVKPTHADVGAEVSADISTGKYRFLYRKRFHKKCETELTVLSPAREQLTGDEAHDRVRAILDETVDTGLWRAQRVLQASAVSAVDLSGCDALSRALDVAAGDELGGIAALSGAEPALIDKVEAEYGRYFTSTGRPTGEWATATKALTLADAEVAACAAAVAEVDERVREHADLTDQLSASAAMSEAVSARLTAAESAGTEVAAVHHELQAARADATASAAASSLAAAAGADRRRLCAELGQRAEAVQIAQAAADQAVEAAESCREVLADAQAAAVVSAEHVAAHQDALEAARQSVAACDRRVEALRLADRIRRAEEAAVEHATVVTRLADITVTHDQFSRIEAAAAKVDRAQAHVEIASPTVQFTAESDLELSVGDRKVRLVAGQSWSPDVGQDAAVRLPGQLEVRVDLGATAAELNAKLVAAQEELSALLEIAAVPDLDAARTADSLRHELTAQRDQVAATLAGILGADQLDELRSRAADLSVIATTDIDADVARSQLAAAERTHAELKAAAEADRDLALAADRQLAEKLTAATFSHDRAATAASELTTVSDRLAALRADLADDLVEANASAAAAAAQVAEQHAQALAETLQQLGPDAVSAELAAARTDAEELQRRLDALAQALRDVTVQLEVFGSQGRTGKLDAAQISREHAAAQHARIQRRARAAELLREVLTRHRDDTRRRYVQPFRSELERLGRTVFGPTFEVEVDSELRITNRTLAGRTVPFDSLSGGAQEQLGILARLAVAALVADEDSVPVLIDDALGFSDPERLAKMGGVLDQVGAQGQVIVLTCSAERYDAVVGAHRVQLSA